MHLGEGTLNLWELIQQNTSIMSTGQTCPIPRGLVAPIHLSSLVTEFGVILYLHSLKQLPSLTVAAELWIEGY